MDTIKEKIKYRVGDLIVIKYSNYGEVIGIISSIKLNPLYTNPIDSTIIIKWNDTGNKISYSFSEIDTCTKNGYWEYYPVRLDKKCAS